jgi:photoactive yellow protein
MSSSPDALTDHELQARWSELCDILGVSAPSEAIARVQELQLDAMQDTAEVAAAGLGTEEAERMLSRISDRIGALRQHAERREEQLSDLQKQQQKLEEAGIRGVSEALSMIRSMEDQLKELYREKETTSRADEQEQAFASEDTFQQLQRLMAREEKLQRELGVVSSEEVIEMVRGLASQLDELYQERDATQPVPPASAGDGSQAVTRREEKLQRELGVSDPADVINMVNGLVEQLEELYEAREKLSQVNLDDAESVIGMISSMEQQLEMLYSDQERMSDKGIGNIDQAISMIESMEEQLSMLYEERQSIDDMGDGAQDEEAERRLQEMEKKLEELSEEKAALQKQRAALKEGDASATLERELGLSDPEHVVQLVQSMEDQLQDLYAERESHEDSASDANTRSDEPRLISKDALNDLPKRSPSELNNMDVGVIRIDDEGRVRFANDRSAQLLPGVAGSTGDDMHDRNFFFSLAPGANNSLFRGRFKQGVENDSLDEQFAYTFIHPTEPRANLSIYLYRSGRDDNWILMQPLSV